MSTLKNKSKSELIEEIESLKKRIKECERIKDMLQEGEERFHNIFEHSGEGIFLINPKGYFLDVNRKICQMFGYTREEFLQVHVTNFHPPEIVKSVWEVFEQVEEEGHGSFEIDCLKKSGEVFSVEILASSLKIGDENLIQGVILDITERKKAEAKLQESESRFRNIFEEGLVGIALAGSDYRFLRANPLFCKMFGYSENELQLLTFKDLTHPEYIESSLEDAISLFKGKPGKKREKIYLKKNKEQLWGEVAVTAIRDEKGNFLYYLAMVEDISEKKKAQLSLEESEKKFLDLYDNAPDMFVSVDAKTSKIKECNQTIIDNLGYSKQEILGSPIFKLYHADSLEGAKRAFKKFIETGEVRDAELQLKRKDGSKINASLNVSAVRDEEGAILYSRSVWRNITDRKQAEEALRDSERKYREMTDLLPQIVYETDLNANLTFSNKQANLIFGYSETDLMKNFNVLDNVIPEDRERARENMQKIMNGKTADNSEYTLIKKDGSTFPVLIYSNQVLKDGKPAGLRGTIVDITERKQGENKIKENQQRLSSHMNNTPLGSIFWDIDFNVIEWNLSAERIFGYSKEEALGRHPYKLIVPLEIQGQIDDVFNNLLTQTGGSRSVNENITKDGKRILCDWYNVAITDINGIVTGVASLVDDITERTLTERKLKESRNQLRSLAKRLQMIREEERATVAREIHDDLGQTLTALKMDISWMKKNSGMSEEMKASKLDGILGLTDSTIQTVKRIATDLRPGILDDLGLVSAIEWQTKEFQNRSGIECNFEISVDEFAIEEEISVAVFRIFQESLTNIVRHSQATKVTVTIMRADDFFLVEISDNGVGISAEQISSSKSLGLIGMKERVSVFGGKLQISKEASGGTTVRVYIPKGKES